VEQQAGCRYGAAYSPVRPSFGCTDSLLTSSLRQKHQSVLEQLQGATSHTGEPVILAALRALPEPVRPVPPTPTSFGDTRYPTRKSFTSRMGTSISTLYLDDATGMPHSKEWVSIFTRVMRESWATLVALGLAPPTWGMRNGMVWDWLKRRIYSEFPDVMLCEHDWKLDFFCSKHYSDWRSGFLGSAATVKADSEEKVGAIAAPVAAPQKRVHQRTRPPGSAPRKRPRSRSPLMRLADDGDFALLTKRVKSDGEFSLDLAMLC
jgi:hypothetical protein